MLGLTLAVAAGGVRPFGRLQLPVSLTVVLPDLKNVNNLSDDSVIERWCRRDVYFQLLGALSMVDLQHVIFGTNVQETALAKSTNSRSLEVAQPRMVRLAQRKGIKRKLPHVIDATVFRRIAPSYARARRFKWLKMVLRRQGTIRGVAPREVQRKMGELSLAAQVRLSQRMTLEERIGAPWLKETKGPHALLAPEAESVSKGKSRNHCESGVKASIDVTHLQGLVLGTRAAPCKTYYGHTAADRVKRPTRIADALVPVAI